ncbi:MAG TPA: glycosyltransferase [Planctomycetota bacterium]|nr:glycosyltransferase [Planctomycetota bacterium]
MGSRKSKGSGRGQLALSVLVPTRDRAESVARLLAGLGSQTLDGSRFEVIVVDDGSREPLRLDPERHPFALRLVHQDPAGPGAARNRALEHARAPLVLILNDDARPARDLLAVHLAAHARAPGRCAVLGSFPFTAEARRSPFVRLLEETDLLFAFSKLKHGKLHGWPFFWTCNLSLSASALRSVGGFDAERFPEAVVEDVELGYRLAREGWRVLYRADARCEHEHRFTPEGFFSRAVRLGFNLHRMWEKHRDPSIMRCKDADEVERLLAGAVDAVEHHREILPQLLSAMRLIEVEYAEKALPPETLARARTLLDQVGGACLQRGYHMASTGVDPVEVAEQGPPPGGLTSVIVLSCNALPKTRRCIESLRRAREAEWPVEILVVDNGSSDGSAEWLADQPDLALIRNDRNEGAPRARNQALARARGDWIAFLDNDVYVTQGWLARALYHGAVDPSVGAVCLVANRGSKDQQISYPGGDGVDEIEAFAAERARDYARRGLTTQLFTSFAVLVRRAVVEAIGGFDERFSPWGFEDDDYSLRILHAGWRNRVAQDVFVYHAHYDDARKSERHRGLLQANWREFARKWGSGAVPEMYDYAALGLETTKRLPREALHVPLVRAEETAPASVTSSATGRGGARSVLVLGSGRSGTSMLAGTLARAGWYVGEDPYPARDSNPKGFFETEEVNGINEALLAQALPAHPRFGPMQRWLAEASGPLAFELTPELRARMARLAERRPFAFKDPRFSYTLPVWREVAGELACLCIFREPAATAESIVRECAREEYLRDLTMDFERAARVWAAMYRSVLEQRSRGGDWLFLHYDQLFEPEGIARLEAFLGSCVDREFPDRSLARSRSARGVPEEAARVYRELCALAGKEPAEIAVEPSPPAPAELGESRPQLSVIVCTYQRCSTLERCLDAFEAQDAPTGSFELIVVDDGSTDGTRAMLDGRRFRVPTRVVHRPNGGLSAARNSGLALASGELVLLVNDDTIATHGLVAAHLDAHRRLAGSKVAVLGTFEQPPAALDNALMRVAERTFLVFCYAGLDPSRVHDWNRFWTCNVSVPLAAVRTAGGFDEDFRHYGCEDTDLALRLDELGFRVHFEPSARAFHEHLLSFDDLARRNRTVARAWVRLFRKHPRALAHSAWKHKRRLTLAGLERTLREAQVQRRSIEDSARALASIDVGKLERSGARGAELAKGLLHELQAQLMGLNELWWCEGELEGLREQGLESFAELVPPEPWPLATQARRRVLAWPSYGDSAELEGLFESFGSVLCSAKDLCLCLRHAEETDGSLDEAVERVRDAYDRVLGTEQALELLIVDDRIEPAELARLGRAVDCVLQSGAMADPARSRFARELQTRVVSSAARLQEILDEPAPVSLPPAKPADLATA